jgi:hypothetical protein
MVDWLATSSSPVAEDDIIPAADRSRVYLLMLQTGIEGNHLHGGQG